MNLKKNRNQYYLELLIYNQNAHLFFFFFTVMPVSGGGGWGMDRTNQQTRSFP